MKKVFLFSASVLAIALTSCGPAAEDRNRMLSSSKVFQDSIAKMLKESMDEAAIPGPAMSAPAPAPATPTAPAK